MIGHPIVVGQVCHLTHLQLSLGGYLGGGVQSPGRIVTRDVGVVGGVTVGKDVVHRDGIDDRCQLLPTIEDDHRESVMIRGRSG